MGAQYPWDEEPKIPVRQEEEILMPDKGDKLFQPSNIDYSKNAIIKTGIEKFFLFSDSYKTAATELYTHFDGSPLTANTLCYPYIYLNRHFIELRLKEMILGLNFAKNQKYEFSQDNHFLKKLWTEFIQCTKDTNGYETDSKQLTAVGLLIEEFENIDPKSFSFRYPVDTKGNPSLPMENLDLENFKNTMQKLYNFFDQESYKVSYFVEMTEEYINIMASEYYNSFR